jgi:uncharacterized membrane protein
MQSTIAIRKGKERLRYTVVFELLLVTMLMTLGAFVFKRPVFEMGLLAVILSAKAMLFNLLYNWYFDLMDVRANRVPTKRILGWRIVHTFGFEIGLAITSLPFFIWWLGLSFQQALMLNASVISFAFIYTFSFNWIYDHLFPVSQPNLGAVSSK